MNKECQSHEVEVHKSPKGSSCKKRKISNSLKEVVEIHDFSSDLDACVTKLEDSLKDAEKLCKTASDSVKEKTASLGNRIKCKGLKTPSRRDD